MFAAIHLDDIAVILHANVRGTSLDVMLAARENMGLGIALRVIFRRLLACLLDFGALQAQPHQLNWAANSDPNPRAATGARCSVRRGLRPRLIGNSSTGQMFALLTFNMHAALTLLAP